jgi:hypothetical protein
MYLCSVVFICACVFLLYVPLFNCFYLCVYFLLVCTFVQLFLSVRVFSSRMNLCSIGFICACVYFLYLPLFNCFYSQIKTTEQRYIQEENTRIDKNNWAKVHTRGKTRTDKNNWTKVQTRGKHRLYLCSIVFICACIFFLFVPLFNCFYLYVCFPLVCTFVQLFLSLRVFSSCTYKRKPHAQIKTVEQMYIQEENRRTDKNNWTKVQTRRKYTHR